MQTVVYFFFAMAISLSLIHGSSYGSPRFYLDCKTGVNRRKSTIYTIYKGSVRVAMFLYSSSTNSRRSKAVPLRTTTVNDSGITDAHNATTVRYGVFTVNPVVPRAPTIVYGLMVFKIMIFEDNV